MTTNSLYYDYENQAWVRDGIYLVCGHPDSMQPNCCYAGVHVGELAKIND